MPRRWPVRPLGFTMEQSNHLYGRRCGWFQIRTLILTMLYRLTPTLIQEGYVYIAESPLFEIICKGDTWFAYSNAEKDSVVAKLKGKNCDIQRSKGLGENDPDMMWLTTMNRTPAASSRLCPRMWSRLPLCLTCFWATTCKAVRIILPAMGTCSLIWQISLKRRAV